MARPHRRADTLAEDNALAVRSLTALESLLLSRGDISPIVITCHAGWFDDLDFVFVRTELSAAR